MNWAALESPAGYTPGVAALDRARFRAAGLEIHPLVAAIVSAACVERAWADGGDLQWAR